MSLELPYSIQPTNAFFLEEWQGPYITVAAANAAVPSGIRLPGKTVVIDSGDGQVVEYWWKGGITDGDLIEKTTGITGSYVPLTGTSEFSGNLIGQQETMLVGNGIDNLSSKSSYLINPVSNAAIYQINLTDTDDTDRARTIALETGEALYFIGDVAAYDKEYFARIDEVPFSLPHKEWIADKYIPLAGSDQISGNLFGNVDTLKFGLLNANIRSTSLFDTNVVNANVEFGGYSSFFEASANDLGQAQAILAAQGIDFSELRSFSVVNNQEFLFFGDVAKYNVDRSTEIDSIDFALPNKEWVLAAISAGGGGGGNTFENGLTRDSGTGVVTLGGELSSTVIIDGDGINPVEFNIGYNHDLQAFNVRSAYTSYTAIGDNSGFSMVTQGVTDGGTGLPDVCSASIIISQPDQTSAIAVFGANNTATLYTPVVACSSLGWVVIGDPSGAITTPNPKSALEIISTNQTFVPPCMTYAQKIAIGTPKVGSMVYQTNANGATDPIGMYVYKQTGGWKLITTA